MCRNRAVQVGAFATRRDTATHLWARSTALVATDGAMSSASYSALVFNGSIAADRFRLLRHLVRPGAAGRGLDRDLRQMPGGRGERHTPHRQR